MIIEACVENFAQCIKAQKQGANRIELCADLESDGLSPSYELMKIAKDGLNIPIRAMVRSRAGDFCYTEKEVEEMLSTIDLCKEVGVEGVVFGACTTNQELDLQIIERLADRAKPMKVTIHKAIDCCKNPVQEIKALKKLKNVDAVLTSGAEPTADQGQNMLRMMIKEAAGQLEIIACGKVTNENLQEIHQLIGAKAYHGKLIVGSLD